METRILATARPVRLGVAPTRTALEPAAASRTLAARAAALPQGNRLYLLIRGLSVEEDPGVVYQLYLDLPPQANPADHAALYVGSINFYGVPPGSNADRVFQSIDVTDTVRGLHTDGRLTGTTTVTFLPAGTPVPGASAGIASVEIVERRAGP